MAYEGGGGGCQNFWNSSFILKHPNIYNHDISKNIFNSIEDKDYQQVFFLIYNFQLRDETSFWL